MAANSVAPSGEQLDIEFGDQRAVIVEFGGGLRSYAVGDVDVLDGYGADEMCTSGRGQVLMPWPNRIEGGSYELDGRRQQLALSEPENGNAIHGLVRWARWSVAERDAHRVAVEHVLHPQPGYPFTLALRIEYALSEDGLAVRTTATNVGTGACPFGSGAHPLPDARHRADRRRRPRGARAGGPANGRPRASRGRTAGRGDGLRLP